MVRTLRALSDFLFWIEGGIDRVASRLIQWSNAIVFRQNKRAAQRDGSGSERTDG